MYAVGFYVAGNWIGQTFFIETEKEAREIVESHLAAHPNGAAGYTIARDGYIFEQSRTRETYRAT